MGGAPGFNRLYRAGGGRSSFSNTMPRVTVPSKTRGWCFTINNPTEEDEERLKGLKFMTTVVKYIVCGTEIGEEGTCHIQGYIKFCHPTTFTRLKSLLGSRSHVEMQRGTDTQAADYCKKDGDFWEHGEVPKGKIDQKEKWREIIKLAKAGELDQLEEKYPYVLFSMRNKILALRERPSRTLEGELEHEWWVGESGTGKSKEFRSRYTEEGFYFKQANKWWDNYQDEEVVLLEELSPIHECLATHMKIWCDRYDFSGEIKGGMIQRIRPRKIVVISNYEIEQVFTKSQDNEPMKRRFKVKRFYSFFNEVMSSLQ